MTTRPELSLARKWRKKLRAAGFVDLELPDGTLRPAAKPPGRWRSFDKASPVEREATSEYFRRALHFTHKKTFLRLNRKQRAAWRLHARGLSNTEVSSRLNLTVKFVRHTLKRARLLAGLPEVTSSLGHGK